MLENNYKLYSSSIALDVTITICLSLEIEAMSSTTKQSTGDQASCSSSLNPKSTDPQKTSLYPFCQTSPYDYDDEGEDERENVSTRIIQALISEDMKQRLSTTQGEQIPVGDETFTRTEVENAYINMEKFVNFGSAMERLISMHPTLTANLAYKNREYDGVENGLDASAFVDRVVNTIDVNKEVEAVSKGINQLVIYLNSILYMDTNSEGEPTNVWGGDEVVVENLDPYFQEMQSILDQIEKEPYNLFLKHDFLTRFDYTLLKRRRADRKKIYNFNVKSSTDLKKCIEDVLSNVVKMHKAQYIKAIDDEMSHLNFAIKMLQTFIDFYGSKMTDDLKSRSVNNINKCFNETQKLFDLKNKFSMDEINETNLVAQERLHVSKELNALDKVDCNKSPSVPAAIKKKKFSSVFQIIANVVDKMSI